MLDRKVANRIANIASTVPEVSAPATAVPPSMLSQPDAAASGAVGAVGVDHTLERPLVREPVRYGSPQPDVELGSARSDP